MELKDYHNRTRDFTFCNLLSFVQIHSSGQVDKTVWHLFLQLREIPMQTSFISSLITRQANMAWYRAKKTRDSPASQTWNTCCRILINGMSGACPLAFRQLVQRQHYWHKWTIAKDLNGIQSCNTNAAESIQPEHEKLISTDKGIISWNSKTLSSEHTVLQSTAETEIMKMTLLQFFFCSQFRNQIWIHFSTNSQTQHHRYNCFLNNVYASKFNDEIFLHWPNLEKFPTSLLSSRIAIIYKWMNLVNNLDMSHNTQHIFIHLSTQSKKYINN